MALSIALPSQGETIMKTRKILFRFRLLINVLALAVALSALYLSPVAANPPGRECDGGCISWDIQHGCVVCQTCCVYNDGHYVCTQT